MTETISEYQPPAPEGLNPPNFSVEEVLVAGDRGPCGGVIRAINATEQILEMTQKVKDETGIEVPVYANHSIVHNELVKQELEEKGLKIQPDPDRIKQGEIYILSAHGTRPSIVAGLLERGVIVLNTECQLVTADRTRAINILASGKDLGYIGKAGHPEPEAVIGDLDPDRAHLIDYRTNPADMPFPDRPFGVLTQTTLSRRQNLNKVNAWSSAHPDREQVVFKDGSCIATDHRQDSLHDIFDIPGKPIDMAITVGSINISQNTRELFELAERALKERGGESISIDSLDDLKSYQDAFTPDVRRVSLTSGASVPDKITVPVLQWMHNMGAVIRVTDAREKFGSFKPPKKDLEIVSQHIYQTYGVEA